MNTQLIFAIFLGIIVYLLPSILAVTGRVPMVKRILFINIISGWTIIGWFALIGHILNKMCFDTYDIIQVKIFMTKQEIIEDFWQNLPNRDILILRNIEFGNIRYSLCGSFGSEIRFKYKMWDINNPYFDNNSMNIYEISNDIIEEIWKRVHAL